jgi:hypothetical protein
MPSVRIRDSAYLQPFCDTSPPTTNQDDGPTSPTPFFSRMRTTPTLRNQRSNSSTFPQSRPQRSRSGSTASRVHDHILRYSLSVDQQSSSSALPLLSDEGNESQRPLSTSTMSRRNLRHTTSNADSIRATYGSEIHHDDVIEHLDVIGAWLYIAIGPHLIASL